MSPPMSTYNLTASNRGQYYPDKPPRSINLSQYSGIKTRNIIGTTENSPAARGFDGHNPLSESYNESRFDSFHHIIRERLFDHKRDHSYLMSHHRDSMTKTAS